MLFALNPWLIPTENCLYCLLLTDTVPVILSHTLYIMEAPANPAIKYQTIFFQRCLIRMSREIVLLG